MNSFPPAYPARMSRPRLLLPLAESMKKDLYRDLIVTIKVLLSDI